MTTQYEWDIETLDLESSDDPGERHIIDHNFFDQCPGIPTDPDKRLVLVRDVLHGDNLHDRTWAYEEGGKLPEFFSDAYGEPCKRVPQRMHTELEKAQQ